MHTQSVNHLGTSFSTDENERLYQLLDIVIGPQFGNEPQEKLQKTLELKYSEAVLCASYTKPELNQVLLDLGSGLGVFAGYISGQVKKVICCDIYREMLELAQSLNKDKNNIEYVHINSYDLSLIEKKSIDILYSSGLFIHFNIYDTYLYFREFERVIKPGGKFFINLRNENELHMEQFLCDAKVYEVNGHTTDGLHQWMAPNAVIRIAEHYGFELIDLLDDKDDCWLYFCLKD